MSNNAADEPRYSREEIKNAIAQELLEAEHMGVDNGNYYLTVGIVIAALDRLDRKKADK